MSKPKPDRPRPLMAAATVGTWQSTDQARREDAAIGDAGMASLEFLPQLRALYLYDRRR